MQLKLASVLSAPWCSQNQLSLWRHWIQ